MLLIVIVLIVLVIWAVTRIGKTVIEVRGHWQHYFDTLQFSSQEFYTAIEATVKAKEIPQVSTSRITYSEGGMLSANREYLRISRGTIVFDICAAPFAKGFFISSWQGDLPNITLMIVSAIPFIGKSMAQGYANKTYYQLDAEQMFTSAVHQGVLEAIDTVTNTQGIRQLSELERTFHQQK